MNNEFKEIEDLLAKADVGSDRYKQTIFNKLKYRMETGTLKTNNNLENNCVNKKKIFKPAKVTALALGVVMVGTGAAYGSQMISEIIQRFTVGRTEIVQYDIDESTKYSSNEPSTSFETIQEGFKGKLFDKDGNEALFGEHQEYYNKDGELITSLGTKGSTDGNGEIEFFAYTDSELGIQRVFTWDEIKNSVNDNIKFPTYLPEGYEFKEATNERNGERITVVYENQFRDVIELVMSTTKESTTGMLFDKNTNIEEKYIDDKKVILASNGAFWESEGVTYQLHLHDSSQLNNSIIDSELVSKMIKSMK